MTITKPTSPICRWCQKPSGDEPLVREAQHYTHPSCSFCPEAYPLVTEVSIPGTGKAAQACKTTPPGKITPPAPSTYRLTSTGTLLKAVRPC